MKTQDGKQVQFTERDEQLIVEHGTWRRLQKNPDEELYQRVPKGDYTQTQPVTYYTHMLERKHYQNSAAVGPNPFARTSGFTQTADQTKSVSGYYGNIDFEQEQSQIGFRKTKGTDLNLGNPYVERDCTVTNFSEITKRVIDACKFKSAANGLRGLKCEFRKLDKNGDGMIDPTEFKFGLKSYGIEVTEDELKALMKYFDTNRDGKISLNEMIHAMRSGSLNERRVAFVEKVYAHIQKQYGQVNIEALENEYDVTPNPEYQSGKKSANQLVGEFLEVWPTQARDGVISFEEFLDYYTDVSPTIISDDVFENMLRNTWRIS